MLVFLGGTIVVIGVIYAAMKISNIYLGSDVYVLPVCIGFGGLFMLYKGAKQFRKETGFFK